MTWTLAWIRAIPRHDTWASARVASTSLALVLWDNLTEPWRDSHP